MFYYIFRVFKIAFFWLDFILLTSILLALAYIPFKSRDKFYPKLFRIWCKAFVRALDVDLKLHQKNLNPLPGQYILIANHPSAFEDIGVPALFNVHSLAKQEVRHWPVFGPISAAAGTLYVNRESRESRAEAGVQIAEDLAKGKNIALYPEGGCKGKRIFETFRYGAFDISLNTGIPILPVFLHYEAQDDFAWVDPHTLVDKMWHFLTTKNNRANYYVYDALDPADFAGKEEYMAHVHGLYLSWQAKYLE